MWLYGAHMTPRIGLALIARDEQDTLPTLLESIAGAFDRVVLLDTGSTDRTVEIFETWAQAERQSQGEGFTSQTGTFPWGDDFAAARNAADKLLVFAGLDPAVGNPGGVQMPLVDWTCWADCDDELVGAQNLRSLAAQAPAELAAYMADYEYAHDGFGNCICLLRRERLVRAGNATWTGRVHEAQLVQGPAQMIDPAIARWVHRKPPTAAASSDRNVRILTAWEQEEPENARVLAYLGTENLARGDLAAAEPFFHRYLALKTGWDEERAQVHRKLAVCLLERGDLDGAEQVALQALTVLPLWPDSYLTLSAVCHQRHEWAKCEQWARRVLELGTPDTMLIVNPLEYSFTPRLLLASALGGQQKFEEAVEVGTAAFELVPTHQDLQRGLELWRQQVKRLHTTNTVLGLADLLVQHDEQGKALELLDACAPYYVHSDPRFVAYRSALRERLGALTDAQPQDERGIPDEELENVVPMLSRAGFLLNGVREQLELAA